LRRFSSLRSFSVRLPLACSSCSHARSSTAKRSSGEPKRTCRRLRHGRSTEAGARARLDASVGAPGLVLLALPCRNHGERERLGRFWTLLRSVKIGEAGRLQHRNARVASMQLQRDG
jgi:hypothetical protein